MVMRKRTTTMCLYSAHRHLKRAEDVWKGRNVMSETFSDIVGNEKSGDLLASKKQLVSTPLALLPRTSWWKLFIDRKFHKEASPALLFDREKSKGFHAVMMRVFKSQFDLARTMNVPLDYKEYEKLYQAVSRDVGGIGHYGPSGTDSPDGTTTFPPTFTPSIAALAELKVENIGYWNIPANIKTYDKATDKVAIMYYGSPPAWTCSVGYKMAEGPALANYFLKRYYGEIGTVGGPLAQLTAIVRLVRVLHVYHFFRDANGRLNTMVVLNKLLMENGFPPTIVSDPAIFGGGYTLAELIDDVEAGMKMVLHEIQAHKRFSHLDLAI